MRHMGRRSETQRHRREENVPDDLTAHSRGDQGEEVLARRPDRIHDPRLVRLPERIVMDETDPSLIAGRFRADLHRLSRQLQAAPLAPGQVRGAV